MGKDWDKGVPGEAFWREALRVAKPGAYLLAFGGTRTSHRLACAIEDAGWEIRDTIAWMYGCLSEDSEVLTKDGFKPYHKITQGDMIRIYDIENDIYKWEKPERWNEYSIKQDTAYRIKSDSTDQIVSRNHNCLVERDGSLVFIKAENLLQMERVPVLSCDISVLREGEGELLQSELLWQGEGLVEGCCTFREGRMDKEKQLQLYKKDDRREQSGMEGRTDLQKEEGEVCKSENKICDMSSRISVDGEERWICDGTSADSCAKDGKTINQNGMCSSHKPRCNRQPNRESNVIQDKQRSQKIRTWTTYSTTLATVEKIEYTGLIFCPTVSTGAFVARRNGKAFITGNSGFPKSHNISKAIDKMNGAEKNVIGKRKHPTLKDTSKIEEQANASHGGNPWKREWDITAPASDEAKQWDGWGTALKPAYEPIIVARKPLEGTVASNVLKWGTGGINIDGCRVETDEPRPLIEVHPLRDDVDYNGNSLAGRCDGSLASSKAVGETLLGRFPANLIHDGSDDVLAVFPNSKSSDSIRHNNQSKTTGKDNEAPCYGKYNDIDTSGYADSGSSARFFYCAKASKADRDEGCDDLPLGEAPASARSKPAEGRQNALGNPRSNHHPTVKPTALMRYLCRLVTPPNGTAFDPFMGSGSTGKGAILEGFDFYGIEKEAEYVEISKCRLEYVSKKTIEQGRLF